MVIYSQVEIGGKLFTKAESDRGLKIRSEEGRLYDDAVYPPTDVHSFSETDEPIDGDATEKDKDAALRRFGVEV